MFKGLMCKNLTFPEIWKRIYGSFRMENETEEKEIVSQWNELPLVPLKSEITGCIWVLGEKMETNSTYSIKKNNSFIICLTVLKATLSQCLWAEFTQPILMLST